MAAAAIAAGGSLLGGVLGGKGASKAAKIQAQAIQSAIDEQKSEFATTQANEQPFLNFGTSAVDPLSALLGLSGNGAQGSAIDALKASPLFTSQYNTGQDTILQNAAATGGLRGGNTNNSLAQFGSGLLASVIQNQVGNLGSAVGTGASTAAGLGQLGQANANSVSTLLGQQGGANATAAAAPYAGLASGIGGAANAYGSATGMNSLAALLKAASGGGSINNVDLSGIGSLPGYSSMPTGW